MGKLDQIRALGQPAIAARFGGVSRETKPELIENKGKTPRMSGTRPVKTMADVLANARARDRRQSNG